MFVAGLGHRALRFTILAMAISAGCGSRKSLDRDAGGSDGAPSSGSGGALATGGVGGGASGSGGRADGVGTGGLLGTGGASGSPGGTTGGGGSNACGVEAPGRSAPFPTEFRFHNDIDTPVYLHKGCVGLDFGISACASEFRDQLGPIYRCACACDSASCTGQPSCGACAQPEAVMVPVGGTVSVAWDAIQSIGGEKSSALGGRPFSCVNNVPVPAGRYRVAIRVYFSAARAMGGIAGGVATADFPLPSADNVVDVSLAPHASCAYPGTAGPACTGAEGRETKCTLTVGFTYAWEGGFSGQYDTAELTPPMDHFRRRVFTLDTTKPDLTCRTSIPQCSPDSRDVTTADIVRVTSEPTVMAAFAPGNTPVYGHDERPGDGSILVIRRADDTSLGIGSECASCGQVPRPLTPALRAVYQVFAALRTQQAASIGCEAFGSTF